MLSYLSSDFSMPVLIVQRTPKMFTEALMYRVERRCVVDAERAYGGAALYSGRAFASGPAAALSRRRRKGIHGLL